MARIGRRLEGLRRGSGLVLPVLLLLAALGPAAADWAPAPFRPQIGSRWQVQVTDSTTDSIRATERALSYGFKLTYVARAGEGYRILYELKTITATGNAPSLPVARAAVEALKGVPIHAVTDASGMPIQVDNEAEVAAAIRRVGAHYVQALAGTPQLESLVRRVFDELASAHGPAAAQAFLAPLPELAGAQDTPLKPGEEQRSDSALASPFGGAIKSVKVRALAPDARPEHYAIVETEALDEAALATALAALRQRVMPDGGKDAKASPPEITLSVTRTQRIVVEDGMARAAHTQEMTKATFAGQDGVRARTVEVTLSPAQ